MVSGLRVWARGSGQGLYALMLYYVIENGLKRAYTLHVDLPS